MNVPVSSLSTAILHVADGVRSYRSGGSGSDGTCDCIGLIIGGLKRCGYKWPGIHGSNWSIRNAVENKSTDGNLREGMLVFKYRSRGDTGYALPDRYASDPDQRDYYHVGYVLSADPLDIIHCTTPGPIVHDHKIGKWRVHADLKVVDYSDSQKTTEVMIHMTAIVHSDNGKGANLRKSMDTHSTLLERIPEGSEVELLGSKDGWANVTYRKMTGYVKTEFLAIEDASETQPIDGTDDTFERLILSLDRDTVLRLYEACAVALGIGVG